MKLSVPLFQFVAVDQYGDDNGNSSNTCYADDDCNRDYNCVVSSFV